MPAIRSTASPRARTARRLAPLLALLAACGPAARGRAPTAPTDTVYDEGPLRPADDGTIVAVPGITAPPAGPDAYATEAPAGPFALGPGSDALAAAVQRAWTQRSGGSLAGDARLASLALRIADAVGPGGDVDASLLSQEATRLGLPFATPQTLTLQYPAAMPLARLEAEIVRGLAAVPTNMPLARVGVAVKAKGGARIAVVTLTTAEATFAPVPRHAHRGDAAWLKGGVAERFAQARISVTKPDGSARSWTAPGRTFEAKVPLSAPGPWAIELLGDGATGPVVVANFTVFVDVDEPSAATTPPVKQRAPVASGPITREGAEARLFALINEERATAGAPPVAPYDALVPVARAHSQDMADHGFFGHVSPTTGGPADRVKAAGLALSLIGENLAQGSTPEEVHRLLMESPAHRGALLEKRFTHAGVGVVVTKVKSQTTVVATELFTGIQPAFEPVAAAQSLAAAIGARRASAGAPPLLYDPELAAAAQVAADAFARAPDVKLEDALLLANRELRRLGPRLAARGLRGTQAHAASVPLVLDAADAPFLLDPDARGIGIGLAERPAVGTTGPIVAAILVLGFTSAR